MGALSTCCTVFLVIVNLFFLTLGLVFFGLGLFLRFGTAVIDKYVDSVKESIEQSSSSAGMGTLDLSDFDITEILLPVALGFIFFGLGLCIITVLGCCGSCYKIKCMLIAYVGICIVLLVTQIIVIGILYGSPDTFHDPAKKRLKDGIQSDYKGLNGTNIVSIGWNIVMQKVECCGVKDYSDFTGASQWITTYSGYTLKTPLACCKTLPSDSDFSCADTSTANDNNNYQSVGCYDKIWDDTLGNATIMVATLVCVGLFQILTLVFGIILLVNYKKNRTGIEENHPSKSSMNQGTDFPTKSSKFKGRHRSPTVSPAGDLKPGLKF